MVENLALRHKQKELEEEISGLKKAINRLSKGKEQELADAKLTFMTKRDDLVKIINKLKKKMNCLHAEMKREMDVRDLVLKKE